LASIPSKCDDTVIITVDAKSMKKHVLILLVIVLSGCGQRGPLFLPQEEQRNAPDTQAETHQPVVERADPDAPEPDNSDQPA
jgi:predicted small lipoprotein YifL